MRRLLLRRRIVRGLAVGGDGRHLVFRQHIIDIEQDFHFIADLAHAQDEIALDGDAHARRGFDALGGDVHDLGDRIYDDSKITTDVDHDDTGLFGVLDLLQPKFEPQVDHGDHLAAG